MDDKESTNMIPADEFSLSPYDPSYPVMLLSQGINDKLALADKAAKSIYNFVTRNASTAAQIRQATQKGIRYVLDITENTAEKIDAGVLKLTEENGVMHAQLRRSNGQYGSKLAVKKETFAKGVDPTQIANAMQLRALQEQLADMKDQIALIDLNVQEVVQGQQNDRIGLYYSGLSLFLEAQNISDPDLKNALLAQSLRSLSESTFQIGLSMQSDIHYLTDGKYKAEKGRNVALIDAKMSSINQAFAFIHQASLLRAGIYCNAGQLGAMAAVLKEYSRFIETNIANNALLLSQCDANDTGAENSLWKSRAELKLDVDDIAKQLNAPNKTLYLGLEKEKEDGKN